MKRINIKCPYCGSRAYLRPSSVVYGDHTDDVEAKLYVCARYPACDAYVAAHRDTLLPMGCAAAAGSLLSVLVCVGALVWLRRRGALKSAGAA